MSKIPNPPAFPTDYRRSHGTDYDGMSLRDWFAGQALAGIAAIVLEGAAKSNMSQEFAQKSLVEGVYLIADAMLAERAK